MTTVLRDAYGLTVSTGSRAVDAGPDFGLGRAAPGHVREPASTS